MSTPSTPSGPASTPASGGRESFGHQGFTPGSGFSSKFGGLKDSVSRAREFRQGARAKIDSLKAKAVETKDNTGNAILKSAPSVSAKQFLGSAIKAMEDSKFYDKVLSKGMQTKKNKLKVAMDLAQAITNKKISISSSFVGRKATSDYLRKYAAGTPKNSFAKKREGFSSIGYKRSLMDTAGRLTDNPFFKKHAKGC